MGRRRTEGGREADWRREGLEKVRLEESEEGKGMWLED